MSVKDIGDGRYMVRVYNPHGREYRKVVVGKRAAQAHEADMKSKLNRSTILDPGGSRMTLRQYAEDHLATRNLRPSTRSRYTRELELHIYPELGSRPLRSIRHSDVVAFQTRLAQSFGEGYTKNVVVLLRSLLRAATLDGLLERNPAAGIKVPEVGEPHQPMPTWSDVRAVVKVATPEVGTIVMLGALTGLRASEMCGLAVSDVAMLRREATVRRQLLRVDGAFLFGPPKTPESERTVPLPAVLVDRLATHLSRDWGVVEAPGGSHRLVVGKGKPVSGTSLANRVRAAAVKADVIVTPHGLRRLYTTTLLDAGVPLRAVDYLTGHRSRGMTLGVYAKVTPEAIDRARAALDAAWLGTPAGDVGADAVGE